MRQNLHPAPVEGPETAAAPSAAEPNASIRLSDYDYELPPERIAQEPVTPRDSARLLVLHRADGAIEHRIFRDLPDYLSADDLLVVNETRVTAVRLMGVRAGGGALEALLLRPVPAQDGAAPDTWESLVRPGRKVREGDRLSFPEAGLEAEVIGRTEGGGRLLRFVAEGGDVASHLSERGRVPLPPYISAPLPDRERYQTVYSRTPGSAAAPTAGLHFTPELLARIADRGIAVAKVTLDVGLGTFRPVRVENVAEHEMHSERFEVPEETARAINACKGRVIAVGTTTLRALESAAKECAGTGQRIQAMSGETRLFVLPGYDFRAVDALITNFHQPHSTLLLLVGAFAGRDNLRRAYDAALAGEYRFLSFGDAMFLV